MQIILSVSFSVYCCFIQCFTRFSDNSIQALSLLQYSLFMCHTLFQFKPFNTRLCVFGRKHTLNMFTVDQLQCSFTSSSEANRLTLAHKGKNECKQINEIQTVMMMMMIVMKRTWCDSFLFLLFFFATFSFRTRALLLFSGQRDEG